MSVVGYAEWCNFSQVIDRAYACYLNCTKGWSKQISTKKGSDLHLIKCRIHNIHIPLVHPLSGKLYCFTELIILSKTLQTLLWSGLEGYCGLIENIWKWACFLHKRVSHISLSAVYQTSDCFSIVKLLQVSFTNYCAMKFFANLSPPSQASFQRNPLLRMDSLAQELTCFVVD